MKYLLRPLDSDYPDLWFDTNNINDLARIGGWGEDVVYVAGTAYHAPLNEKRPSTRITIEYVRELEAEAVAVKAERDELIGIVAGIAADIDTANIIMRDNVEHYLLYWDDYVALRKIAAANEATP